MNDLGGGTAPSPFLASGLQYAFDSTSLGWLMECARKYQYAMLESWRSKSESVHLRFGQLYHSALEMFDKRRAQGADHEDIIREVTLWVMLETWDYETGKPWTTDHNLKTRETLVRSVIWYMDKFKDDPAKTLVFPDGKAAVELSFRFDLPFNIEGQPYILSGHMDRIVEWAGDIWATDRKTSSGVLNQKYFADYKPDAQMSIYTLATQVVFSIPAKGVLIDAVQIGVGFSAFGRGVTYRTEEELEEDLKDIEYWLDRAVFYHNAGYWPKNPKSCHKYGGCQFLAVCSKAPSVRSRFLESDFVKHPWNPLEAR